MEHVLGCWRHGFTETVVTVQFLAALVRNYFGDGEELGMELDYATEETPLGTAGSVKNAEDGLRDGTFLVISGDALTDIDLTALVRHHRRRAPWSRSASRGCRTRWSSASPSSTTTAGSSGSWRSRPGARSSRHRQHRHLRHGARGPRPGRGR